MLIYAKTFYVSKTKFIKRKLYKKKDNLNSSEK